MPAIANISLVDGKATPETHLFEPVSSTPPKFRRAVSGQALIAQERMELGLKEAKTANAANIATIRLELPVSEVPAGGAASGYVAPPAIAHVQTVEIKFYLHSRSESSGRKDLRVLASNALKDPLVVALVDDLRIPY